MVANENKEMMENKDKKFYNTLRGEPVVEQKEIDEMGKTESFLDVENNLGLIIFLRRFIDSQEQQSMQKEGRNMKRK